MKNSACSIGLVGLCLLKATLVWSLWCCGGGALAILGTGVLGLAQLQWPGRVNRGCGNKTRNWPQVGFFFSLSARGEGRNRPDFPAVAPLICLISLGIQAKSVLSARIVFNPFGVRFGVRLPISNL